MTKQPYATPDTLLHDEWLLRWAREYLEAGALTVAPVVGPHSIDIIVFDQKEGEIRFVEVKGRKAAQSPLEKKLQAFVQTQPGLRYELRRYGK